MAGIEALVPELSRDTDTNARTSFSMAFRR